MISSKPPSLLPTNHRITTPPRKRVLIRLQTHACPPSRVPKKTSHSTCSACRTGVQHITSFPVGRVTMIENIPGFSLILHFWYQKPFPRFRLWRKPRRLKRLRTNGERRDFFHIGWAVCNLGDNSFVSSTFFFLVPGYELISVWCDACRKIVVWGWEGCYV